MRGEGYIGVGAFEVGQALLELGHLFLQPRDLRLCPHLFGVWGSVRSRAKQEEIQGYIAHKKLPPP